MTLRRLDEAARLAELEGFLARSLLEFDPSLAYERGLAQSAAPRQANLLDAYGNWSTALRSIQAAATAVDAEALSSERRLDLLWLRSWAHAEALLAEGWTTARWNPRLWFEREWKLLQGPLRDESVAIEARALQLGGELLTLPTVLNEARLALRVPSGELARSSVLQAEELARVLEREVWEFGADHVPSGAAYQAFEAARSAALVSARAARTWLAEEAAVAGVGPERLAPGLFEELLAATTGTQLGIEDLRAVVLLELSDMERRLGASAPLPRPAEQLPDAAEIVRLLEAGSHSALKLAAASGVALPEAPAPRFACSTPHVHSGAWVRWSAAPGAAPMAWIELPPADSAGPERGTRAALLGTDALRALGIQLGAVGEGLARSLLLSGTSTTGRCAANRAALEGFGLYATDWMTRLPPGQQGPLASEGLRMELLRRRKLAAARLLLAIEIHGRGVAFEDAAPVFAAYTGFDPATAREEAMTVIGDPLGAFGYLGYMELVRLERQLGPANDPLEAARRTLAVFLRNPAARAVDWAALAAPGGGGAESNAESSAESSSPGAAPRDASPGARPRDDRAPESGAREPRREPVEPPPGAEGGAGSGAGDSGR